MLARIQSVCFLNLEPTMTDNEYFADGYFHCDLLIRPQYDVTESEWGFLHIFVNSSLKV